MATRSFAAAILGLLSASLAYTEPAGNGALQYWLGHALLPDYSEAEQAMIDNWARTPLTKETQDNAGQARHHLDHGLDHRLYARTQELARENRGEQRDRRPKEHGVERSFERTEDQRHEPHLWLKVIARTRALPHVHGSRVALVPDRPE